MKRSTHETSWVHSLFAISLIGGLFFLAGPQREPVTMQGVLETTAEEAHLAPLEELDGSKSTPEPVEQIEPMPVYTEWQTFTRRDGLPSNKTYCVRTDGKRVWIGTDKGLASYENERWRTYGVSDGLAHPAVLSIDVCRRTGDVWIATMGGLSRWSAGRFDTFNQFNSGLANDVVYGVACAGDFIWAATASGASRLDTRTGQWRFFNENSAPMHEPWAYGVSASDDMVYVAVWGGGVVEFNERTGRWRDYRDPDKEMEIDLFPNDGLVHDVTATVSYEDGILWVGTYFGLNRYDGTRWWGYFDHDSGLASNFINFVRAKGSIAWIATDKGLNSFDGVTWVTYRRDDAGASGEILVSDGRANPSRQRTATALAHNFVLGVDIQDETIWVATAKGVSRGLASGGLNRSLPKSTHKKRGE